MNPLTKEVLLKNDPGLKNRPYQLEALLSIFQYVKCLVKMFCGTGKSRIITNTIIHKKKELSVVVFPSLALIHQYSTDYLKHSDYKKYFNKHKMMNVSSEKLDDTEIDSTTDEKEIKTFLKKKYPKVILVTYQSYNVLLKCLGEEGKKIGLVCYDEAHHIVSPEYQKLVFGADYYEDEVFFTATPRNENGITMFDLDNMEKNMCGPVAYDYSYLQGLKDEFLNQFDICGDMYTKNTNASVYEAIARAILTRGTSRVLSFHSGVNGESNTDVWNFVKQTEFQTAFNKVVENEFPDKKGYYTSITFKGMDGKTPPDERKALLASLDSTPEDEIYMISSCETIGEGVDTKKANMCVFADPKASITKIIQNIGRVVRRNSEHPLSTVLIPCWVNMENYASAEGDPEKQDELIREQMRATNGDYAPILNVLGALRQDDPEIYEMCLNYPNRSIKEESLAEQGFRIVDEDEEDEYDEDEDISEEVKVYSPDEVAEMKARGETPLEIHTNNTIERFNEDSEKEESRMMRLYHDEEEDVYKPIVRIDNEENADTIIQPPNPKKRIGLTFHQNDEIQMLWRVQGELDFSKKFCTVIIECEVVKVDPMEIAIKIVDFIKNKNEGRKPRKLEKHNLTEEEKTERYYYRKLRYWGDVLRGKKRVRRGLCSNEVRDYLDKEIPGWRDELNLEKNALNTAKEIIAFYKKEGRFPKHLVKPRTPNEKKELSYSNKLSQWKLALKCNTFGRRVCFPSVRDLLDKEIPGWRDETNFEENALNTAKEIVAFYKKEGRIPSLFHVKKIDKKTLSNEQQLEGKYTRKLDYWKMAIKGFIKKPMYPSVLNYLDKEMPGWRSEQDLKQNAINSAKNIVAFYKKEGRMPNGYSSKKLNDLTPSEKIEATYSHQISGWKTYVLNGKQKRSVVCYDEVCELLDKEIPGWSKGQELEKKAMDNAKEIVSFYNKEKRLPFLYQKKGELTSEEKLEKKHAQKLTNWKNALKGTGHQLCYDEVRDYLDTEIPEWRKKEDAVINPTPKSRTKKQKALPLTTATVATTETATPHNFPPISDIGTLHKKYLKMRSDTLHQTFKADPQLWREYHATRKQTFATYDPISIPSNRIIQELEKIKTKRQKIVVDMGCGEAPIAHHFKNKNDSRFVFHNYDHQSGGDPLIQEVDISALPLEDADAEIVIMSLALWGTKENCVQYIKEAYRVLESGGKFYISDSTKKWSPEPLTQENGGELLRTLLSENGFTIVTEDIGNPFCFFKCSKIY